MVNYMCANTTESRWLLFNPPKLFQIVVLLWLQASWSGPVRSMALNMKPGANTVYGQRLWISQDRQNPKGEFGGVVLELRDTYPRSELAPLLRRWTHRWGRKGRGPCQICVLRAAPCVCFKCFLLPCCWSHLDCGPLTVFLSEAVIWIYTALQWTTQVVPQT